MFGVTSVGDVENTSLSLPVSSLITPASCADVVAANCDRGLATRASPLPVESVAYSLAVPAALVRKTCSDVPSAARPVPPLATPNVPVVIADASWLWEVGASPTYITLASLTAVSNCDLVKLPSDATNDPVPDPVTAPVSVIVWSPVFVPLLVPVMLLVSAIVPAASGSVYVRAAVFVFVNFDEKVPATLARSSVESLNVLAPVTVWTDAKTMSPPPPPPIEIMLLALSRNTIPLS